MQHLYVYDGTFSGLLSVIFQIYLNKVEPLEIRAFNEVQENLFSDSIEVFTDEYQVNRVLKSIGKHKNAQHLINKVFLSELKEREMLIYKLIKCIVEKPEAFDSDYRLDEIRMARRIAKQMDREVHRMHAFVRFHQLKDNLWFAPIEPDFDVLPLIGKHFEDRYADQEWLIYDVKRKYGIYFNKTNIKYVELDIEWNGSVPDSTLHQDELAYQKLWKEYFEAVDIKSRRNMKLHIRHVPKRYWRFLTEKKMWE